MGAVALKNVFIATSQYRRNDRQHAPSATLPLSRPSADTRVLISAAIQALRSVFRPDFNYAKAGVMLVDLQPQAQEQTTPDLFDVDPAPEADRGGRSDLMTALDALNRRFGRHAVSVASAAGRAGPSAHASKQDRRSPRYTTRIGEIATARA